MSRPIGCRSIELAAPVWMLEVGTHLERDPLVADVGGQVAQRRSAVLADHDVVDDADAVTEPVRTADLQRLPDRRQPERLTGVDREVRVVAFEVVERVEVPGRWVAGLGAGDVEAGHAVVPVVDGQLGDLPRRAGVPHGGEDLVHDDRTAGVGDGVHPVLQAVPDGLDGLRRRQSLVEVLLRRPPCLAVHHSVSGQILDELTGHPPQVRRRLHHRDRVVEGLQVALQRAGGRGLEEPVPQRVGAARGQLVTDLLGELDDRGRSQGRRRGGRATKPSARRATPSSSTLMRSAPRPG